MKGISGVCVCGHDETNHGATVVGCVVQYCPCDGFRAAPLSSHPPRGREAVEQAIDEAMLAAAYASKWDGCLTGDCQHETQDDCNASLLAHMANVADCVAVRAALIALCSPWIAADSPPERLSFAVVCEEAAVMHENIASQYRLLADEPEMENEHGQKAAALRELARLMDSVSQLPQRYYQGRPLIGHGEWDINSAIVRDDWRARVDALLSAIEAGFEPPRQEEG